MKSYSYEMQDISAMALLTQGEKPNTFLDIGCRDPKEGSNSLLLEQNGWQGLCVDIDDHCQAFEEKRRKVRDKGFTHFAITVKNLETTYGKLSDAKIKFVNEPRVSDDGGAKVAFCLDPENNLIELVEVL